MSEDYEEYELERQRTIAQNEALLAQLGLNAFAASSRSASPGGQSSKRRRTANGDGTDEEDELRLKPGQKGGASTRKKVVKEPAVPLRKSSRIAGINATSEEDVKKAEEAAEEARLAFEAERRAARKVRDAQMKLEAMLDEEKFSTEEKIKGLTATFGYLATRSNPRTIPDPDTDVDVQGRKKDADDAKLREKFQGVRLKSTAKITNERVYSLIFHPEPTKSLVFVGDKRGQLGIWDAEGDPTEVADEDEETKVDQDLKPSLSTTVGTGCVWRMQLHARTAISCLRVDPVNGSSLYSSAYDCTVRRLELNDGRSTEVFALDDEAALINHFDLDPTGQEAWMVDSEGGLSHLDMREGKRRRWEISAERANRKIGGVSINRELIHQVPHGYSSANRQDRYSPEAQAPWLLCTASNDRFMRLWDVRQLSRLKMKPFKVIENADTSGGDRQWPQEECDYETLEKAQKGKNSGALRGQMAHGRSCSSAYWDPWGKRILTTSYDDRLRVFKVPFGDYAEPGSAPKALEKPIETKHDCQTGRWVSVFKAQWSQNTEYAPHYTVGSMKRKICVYSGLSGHLIADFYDRD